jgi:hypothetical protein
MMAVQIDCIKQNMFRAISKWFEIIILFKEQYLWKQELSHV